MLHGKAHDPVFVLGTLPLAENDQAVYNNVDLNAMSVKSFRMKAVSDVLEDGRTAWRLESSPSDGGPGGLVIWIDVERFIPLRFEQVVPEAGGAKMTGELKES